MSRAVVYVRQSLDATGEEHGVTRQREDCLALAQARGWTVVAVHVDNDLSASGRKRRPGFEAVLCAIQEGQADVVVAWDLTRLTRNSRDRLRLIEAGRDARATIALVRGSDMDLSTPAGRLTAEILASVAEHEVAQKADRQTRATLQAAQAGRWVSGRRPFGYEADGTTVRPVEAQAVRDGYAGLLAGLSLGAIARAWNAAGHASGQGSPWRNDSVRYVLRNPRYAGLRAHRRQVVGPALWPALVDAATYEAARALLDDPSRRNAPQSDTGLLTGLATCGVCGGPVHGGRTADGVRTYRCRRAYGHVVRQADPVDDYVTRAVVARLSQPDARDVLAEPQDEVDVTSLRQEALGLRARLGEVEADYVAGAIGRAALERARAAGKARLESIEAALASAGRPDVLGRLVTAVDVGEAWEGLSGAGRRTVVETLVDVTILPPGRGKRAFRPDTVTITWN